jgi:alpha-tubulin suppressor-like RCC1 family protein
VAIAPRILPLLGVIGDTVRVRGYAWDQYGNFVDWVPSRAVDTTIVRATADSAFVAAAHQGTTWLISARWAFRDSVPVTVLGFRAVSDGGAHTCAVSLASDVFCWGENSAGAIGDGTTLDRLYPVPIGQGLGLQLPSSDWGHTCALAASGQAYCWGLDQSGELGDGSATYATEIRQPLPVAVAGGHVFSTIRAGNAHTCAVATSGDAYCWGDNNSGQLGRDTLTGTCILNNGQRCSNWPILVTGGLTFTQVSAGPWNHSCGVTKSGAAYCWGQDGSGELGSAAAPETCVAGALPPFPCSHTPQLVQGGFVFKSVKAGNNFTCGLVVSGDGYCWGFGNTGELGNGTRVSSTMPVKVSGGLAFADVQAGEWNACGLTTSGKVYCWGGVSYGATPAPVRPDLSFGALAVGGSSGTGRACALTTDNDLYCWYSRP